MSIIEVPNMQEAYVYKNKVWILIMNPGVSGQILFNVSPCFYKCGLIFYKHNGKVVLKENLDSRNKKTGSNSRFLKIVYNYINSGSSIYPGIAAL